MVLQLLVNLKASWQTNPISAFLSQSQRPHSNAIYSPINNVFGLLKPAVLHTSLPAVLTLPLPSSLQATTHRCCASSLQLPLPTQILLAMLILLSLL
jgi:hypothetical protein